MPRQLVQSGSARPSAPGWGGRRDLLSAAVVDVRPDGSRQLVVTYRELRAAGLLPGTVADDWVAGLWVQIIKGLRLHPKAALREGAEIGWAVRPDNPKLLAILNRAVADITGNPNQWSAETRSYLAKLEQLHAATEDADLQRFYDTVEIFRRYARAGGLLS